MAAVIIGDTSRMEIASIHLVDETTAHEQVHDITYRLADEGWSGEVVNGEGTIEVIASCLSDDLGSVHDSLSRAGVMSACIRWRGDDYTLIGGHLMS